MIAFRKIVVHCSAHMQRSYGDDACVLHCLASESWVGKMAAPLQSLFCEMSLTLSSDELGRGMAEDEYSFHSLSDDPLTTEHCTQTTEACLSHLEQPF